MLGFVVRTVASMLVLALAAVFWSTPARAEGTSKVVLALSAEFTTSTLQDLESTVSGDLEARRGTGFAIRYRVLLAFGERLSLESGIGYVRRSAEVRSDWIDADSPDVARTDDATFTLDAVEIPLLVRHRVLEFGSGFEWALCAGPMLGLRTKSEVDLVELEVDTLTGENFTRASQLDVGDATGTLDLCLRLGTELTRRFEDLRVSLFASLDLGLLETLDATEGPASLRLDGGSARGFAVGVGVSVRL